MSFSLPGRRVKFLTNCTFLSKLVIYDELVYEYLWKSAFLQSGLVSNFFDQIKFYPARPNRAFVTFNRADTEESG